MGKIFVQNLGKGLNKIDLERIQIYYSRCSNVVQDLKEIQKLRKRQQGVSAEDLAATKTEKKEEKVEVCEQSYFR